jgi:hypothetical protein
MGNSSTCWPTAASHSARSSPQKQVWSLAYRWLGEDHRRRPAQEVGVVVEQALGHLRVEAPGVVDGVEQQDAVVVELVAPEADDLRHHRLPLLPRHVVRLVERLVDDAGPRLERRTDVAHHGNTSR